MNKQNMTCDDCPVLKLLDAGWTFVNSVHNILPGEVGEHVLNARREMLLAVRSAIDHRLSKIDKARTRKKKATHIKVK